MEVCITNQCKQRILENSISFQIKGYVFLKDTDHLISRTEDKKTLTLNDFITSNDTIIYNKDHSYFDTTYIPNLEVSNDDNYYFGSYNIKIDKGLDKESIDGLNDTFDAILVIGEDINVITDYNKNTYSITENNKTFLAAIITDLMGINPNNTQSVTIHFAIGEEPISDNYYISNTFTNLNSEMKDLYTTKINDYLFLTPAPNYENAITGTIYYLSNVSIKGNFFPSNISLADEFYKINNIWNVGNSAGTVNIFSKDGYNSKITTPQLMLTCSSCTAGDTPTYDINSFIFKYSQTENSFLMGQDIGNKAIQVDILPEYFERLDISDATNYRLKMCDGFMTGIVQQGTTITSSWYGNISSTDKYFRLASINSNYDASYDIFEIRAENITVKSSSGISFYGNKSYNNSITNTTDSVFFDSHNNSMTWLNDILLFNSMNLSSHKTVDPLEKPNNISFIGSDHILTYVDIKCAINNNTYIGKNYHSRNIYPLVSSAHGTVTDLRKYPDELDTVTIKNSLPDPTVANIGNFAAIGFENLALTRAYPINDDWSVYSVIFGHDNSYTSPYIMQNGGSDKTLYFNNQNDSYFNDKLQQYRALTANEGDYSLYKLVAVGNGQNNASYDPHSPGEYASISYPTKNSYSLDVFSVEKDSFQLINTDFEGGGSVGYIPKLFAVRGHAHILGKYRKRIVDDSETYEGIIDKYYIQNALYTPDKLYVPLPRSSNDVYEIDFVDVYKALNNKDNKKFTKLESSDFPDVEPIKSIVETTISNRNNRIVLEDTPANIDDIKEKYCEIFNITDETEKAQIFSNTDDTIYTVYLVDSNCVKKIIYRGDFINL